MRWKCQSPISLSLTVPKEVREGVCLLHISPCPVSGLTPSAVFYPRENQKSGCHALLSLLGGLQDA